MTPFSATINLKKTVIRNQSEIPLTARSLTREETTLQFEEEKNSLTLKLQEVKLELKNKDTDFKQMKIEQ